jgi:catechol 2,3-dioxygenase
MMAEPIRDVAHLGHVELLTPKLEESRRFFLDVFGLHETDAEGGSRYLRGYGDYDRTTLKLTEAAEPGLGHVGWRAISPQALDRRVDGLERAGVGEGWIDGDIGHGPAYRFRDPDGHLMEIYYESERFRAGSEQRSYLPNQPQAFEGRGAGARRIDHLNLLCADVPRTSEFMHDVLGFRLLEEIVLDDARVAAWMSVTSQPHDIALTTDRSGACGRFHHLAYWVDNREDVLRAAELMMENDVFIECGPAKHSRTQGFYLYVYEPGGNRVEVFSGGFVVYAPDWPTVTWSTDTLGRGTAWGAEVPDSFHSYGTPPLRVAEEASIA